MIQQLRDQLAADLAVTEIPVHPAWPVRPTVPCVVIAPGTPYVDGGQTFGAWVVRFNVLVLVAQGSHGESLRQLDGLIELVLANTVDWALSGVEPPSLVPVGPQQALGTAISLAKGARL